uniref:Uncharacterized protein n=1 Tax=Noctiluca scintillans TaxID=2966 RepID=A0A7S1AGH8_NOCSC
MAQDLGLKRSKEMPRSRSFDVEPPKLSGMNDTDMWEMASDIASEIATEIASDFPKTRSATTLWINGGARAPSDTFMREATCLMGDKLDLVEFGVDDTDGAGWSPAHERELPEDLLRLTRMISARERSEGQESCFVGAVKRAGCADTRHKGLECIAEKQSPRDEASGWVPSCSSGGRSSLFRTGEGRQERRNVETLWCWTMRYLNLVSDRKGFPPQGRERCESDLDECRVREDHVTEQRVAKQHTAIQCRSDVDPFEEDVSSSEGSVLVIDEVWEELPHDCTDPSMAERCTTGSSGVGTFSYEEWLEHETETIFDVVDVEIDLDGMLVEATWRQDRLLCAGVPLPSRSDDRCDAGARTKERDVYNVQDDACHEHARGWDCLQEPTITHAMQMSVAAVRAREEPSCTEPQHVTPSAITRFDCETEMASQMMTDSERKASRTSPSSVAIALSLPPCCMHSISALWKSIVVVASTFC